MVSKPSDRSTWLTVTNNQPMALCSDDNMQVGFRCCWFQSIYYLDREDDCIAINTL